MAFNSINFLFFYTFIFILYLISPNRIKWFVLLVSSYAFYMFAKPEYILVMLFVTCNVYLFGLCLEKIQSVKVRKSILILSIILNLGTLIAFKYINFFTNNINNVSLKLGLKIDIPELKFVVPMGISFFILQALSYIFDVYNGKIKAEKHLGYLATYVSFFPTVLSGPIERGTNLLPQIHKSNKINYERFTSGLTIVLIGVFKKVVIADRLAFYVNKVYDNVHIYKGWPLIVATVFFGIQLYCDFSGYTDIAIGCAKMLGFDLIKNFEYPYFSKNIQEFWKRWHISLTSWFRDYLYIPLGGNRKGKIRTYLNILIVFLASGFWHGASWTFILWGAIHGVYQIIGKLTKGFKERIRSILRINKNSKLLGFIQMIITFILVDFAWIFFRANSISDARYIISNLLVNVNHIDKKSILVVSGKDMKLMLLFVAVFILYELVLYLKLIKKRIPLVIRWILYYLCFYSIIFWGIASNSKFIYVQF